MKAFSDANFGRTPIQHQEFALCGIRAKADIATSLPAFHPDRLTRVSQYIAHRRQSCQTFLINILELIGINRVVSNGKPQRIENCVFLLYVY